MKISKREQQRRERDVQRKARGEQFVHERLITMHDELGFLMRHLDRLVLPRSQRRRSPRKSFVDKVGNLVRFPRGDHQRVICFPDLQELPPREGKISQKAPCRHEDREANLPVDSSALPQG
jgi:hypothetical protein